MSEAVHSGFLQSMREEIDSNGGVNSDEDDDDLSQQAPQHVSKHSSHRSHNTHQADFPSIVTDEQEDYQSNGQIRYNEIFVFGSNRYGQIGLSEQNAGKNFCVPRFCHFNIVFTSVSCGAHHSVLLTQDGYAYTVGSNIYGQLGIEQKSLSYSFTPSLVSRLQDHTIIKVVSGAYHNLALTSDKQLFSWGRNHDGQLGLGLQVSHISDPQVVPTCEKVINVFSGWNHSFFITKRHAVYSFGSGLYGQLGQGKCESASEPTKVLLKESEEKILRIAVGETHSLFLSEKGHLFGCGENQRGQVGLGKNKKVVLQPQPLLNEMYFDNESIIDIACGRFSVALTQKSQTIYAWGALCNDETNVEYTPKRISSFAEIGCTSEIRKIVVGGESCILMGKDGSLFSWGKNAFGECGLADFEPKTDGFQNISFLKGKKILTFNMGETHSVILGREIFSRNISPMQSQQQQQQQQSQHEQSQNDNDEDAIDSDMSALHQKQLPTGYLDKSTSFICSDILTTTTTNNNSNNSHSAQSSFVKQNGCGGQQIRQSSCDDDHSQEHSRSITQTFDNTAHQQSQDGSFLESRIIPHALFTEQQQRLRPDSRQRLQSSDNSRSESALSIQQQNLNKTDNSCMDFQVVSTDKNVDASATMERRKSIQLPSFIRSVQRMRNSQFDDEVDHNQGEIVSARNSHQKQNPSQQQNLPTLEDDYATFSNRNNQDDLQLSFNSEAEHAQSAVANQPQHWNYPRQTANELLSGNFKRPEQVASHTFTTSNDNVPRIGSRSTSPILADRSQQLSNGTSLIQTSFQALYEDNSQAHLDNVQSSSSNSSLNQNKQQYEKLNDKLNQMNSAFQGLIQKLAWENTETNDFLQKTMTSSSSAKNPTAEKQQQLPPLNVDSNDINNIQQQYFTLDSSQQHQPHQNQETPQIASGQYDFLDQPLNQHQISESATTGLNTQRFTVPYFDKHAENNNRTQQDYSECMMHQHLEQQQLDYLSKFMKLDVDQQQKPTQSVQQSAKLRPPMMTISTDNKETLLASTAVPSSNHEDSTTLTHSSKERTSETELVRQSSELFNILHHQNWQNLMSIQQFKAELSSSEVDSVSAQKIAKLRSLQQASECASKVNTPLKQQSPSSDNKENNDRVLKDTKQGSNNSNLKKSDLNNSILPSPRSNMISSKFDTQIAHLSTTLSQKERDVADLQLALANKEIELQQMELKSMIKSIQTDALAAQLTKAIDIIDNLAQFASNFAKLA